MSSSKTPKPSRFKLPSTTNSPSPGVSKKSPRSSFTPARKSSFFRGISPKTSLSPLQNTPLKAVLKLNSPGGRREARIGAIVAVNSPRRLKHKTKTYDRFIPDRNAMNDNSAHFHLKQAGSNEKITPLDQTSLAYQEVMAKACGVAIDKRILSYTNDRTSKSSSNDRHDIRATWNKPSKQKKSTAKRRIALAPEKILDAPGMADDYYLNLMDWSCKNILAVGLEDTVYIWNGDTGEVQEFCKTKNEDYVASLKWATDGSYLAVGTGNGDAQIWDIDSNSKVRSMRGHTARVGVLSWDQHILSSGSQDGRIWNHDVRIASHKVAELVGHTGEVCGLQWRMDGAMLASGGNDNLVHIWDARSSIPRLTKTNHTGAVKAIAWCPWQMNLLASGGGLNDNTINFWNSTSGDLVNSINSGSQVTSIQWSISYKELITSHGYPNNHLSVWSYPRLTKIADLPGHDEKILNTSISPDGQTVASSSSDENLKFWRVFEREKDEVKKKSHSSSTLDLDEDLENSIGRMTIR